MNKGTIVLTHFPFTDLSTSKRRPAIVISKKVSKKGDVIVAFITTVIPNNLEETDLLFDENFEDFNISGLKKMSLIKLDKIATINKIIITGEIGLMNKKTINEIDEKLMIALDLKKIMTNDSKETN